MEGGVTAGIGDEVLPWRIDVPQADLDDLARRLASTRWPEPETVGDWSQGVPLAYLQDLVAHWTDGYDWRDRESRLNRLPQHRTTVDGLGIHLVHAPSPEPAALPLLLTHGWPGSIVEFAELIGPLTDPSAHGGDPADAFHVVAPSLPGYGWTDRPAGTGWGVPRIADAWAELTARLGYRRFGAQGGDWGSAVTSALGQRHPDRLAGIHLNMLGIGPPPGGATDGPGEQEASAALGRYRSREGGYSVVQGTRPQTSIGPWGAFRPERVDQPASLAVRGWRHSSARAGTDRARTTASASPLRPAPVTSSTETAAGWGVTATTGSPPVGTVPACRTRRYQPLRPSRRMRRPTSAVPAWRVNLKHGVRGWHTSRTASPQPHRSPTCTSASVTPLTVRFSPNDPGPKGRPMSASHPGKWSPE